MQRWEYLDVFTLGDEWSDSAGGSGAVEVGNLRDTSGGVVGAVLFARLLD